MIDVGKLLALGQENKNKEHIEKEKKAIGTLRGGSVGCVLTDDGDMSTGYQITGVCPREALARYLGYYQKSDTDKQIMFSLGISNEDIWAELLDYAGANYLREEELALAWDIDGVKATGRPDIVLLDDKDKPALGLELKMVASVWSARNVLLQMKPKSGHLIQAGNYAYRMGVPFELWYTSYVNLAGPDFATRIVPKRGEPGSEWIEYSLGEMRVSNRSKTGKPTFKKIHVYNQDWNLPNSDLEKKYGITASQFKHIKPFRIGYCLMWKYCPEMETERLYWIHEGHDKSIPDNWAASPITKRGIDQYYQLIVDSARTKTLPPRPKAVDAYGDKETFDVDSYSTLQHISDACNDNFDNWLERLNNFKRWINLNKS